MIITGLNWCILKSFLRHQENVVPLALFLDVCAKDLNVQGSAYSKGRLSTIGLLTQTILA
jgi:hypothetical protein